MSQARTVILSAARTPFGKLGGGLASLSGPQLGTHAAAAALERSGVAPGDIGYVVMGEVLQAGAGQIPSRQVSVGIGLGPTVGSETINKVCASGMRAATLADVMIRAGEHDVILAGGMESMSNAPYLLPKGRFGYGMGDGAVLDSMTYDGLTCTFDGLIMAEQNSVVAAEVGISREEQDAWALRSHERAVAAIDGERFAEEIAPVTIQGRKGATVVDTDEGPRRDTSLERLAALKPVFVADGSTTAGNAPGVNDGAAALVLASEELGEGARDRAARRDPRATGTSPTTTPTWCGRRRRRRGSRSRRPGLGGLRHRPARGERGVLLGRAQHRSGCSGSTRSAST